MATGTAGTSAKLYHTDQVHYLAKAISYADGATNVYTLGVLPAGAMIIKPMSGVQVNTVFNSGTNNLINFGTAADDDFFGTVMSLTTATFVPLDEAVSMSVAADTTVTASLALSGTAATTGAGVALLAYVLPGRS
ncbi:MAG: hypothetical protein Q7T86_03145 [Hyphomicrobiaceae bacterium]|nr:hypothetical protein [Hyphomicrobiaceae bacterium]